ncbi:hypothetical protein NQ317_012208 [Molorchus minor]|uniref:Uncharacterized protein n=1 Tax=Molorchus minor TaxID=1323400 RepID=A0ABQ9JBC1_9CUCU|nr:hypothetical protein NQ317_012208 [Molorchus minor]
MQDHIEEISNRTGILHVHLVFGRCRIYAEETFDNLPRPLATDITLLTVHFESPYRYPVRSSSTYTESTRSAAGIWCPELGIDIQVCPENITVRALYDGLLVTAWTTAQKTPQHRWSRSAHLATVLVFLATLTIVGRCYASDDAIAPLVQLNPPRNPRPHYNSKPLTSNLVNRLSIPDRFVKSDIRIILGDYKALHNQNSARGIRSKRDFRSARHNRISLKDKSISEENSTFKDSDPFLLRTRKIFGKSDDRNVRLSAPSNFSESDVLNTTRVIVTGDAEAEPQQNDSSFQEGQELLRTTQRPMPPAHAHDSESCK